MAQYQLSPQPHSLQCMHASAVAVTAVGTDKSTVSFLTHGVHSGSLTWFVAAGIAGDRRDPDDQSSVEDWRHLVRHRSPLTAKL